MSQQQPTRNLRRRPAPSKVRVVPAPSTRPRSTQTRITRAVPSELRVVPAPSTRPRPIQPRNKFEAAALKIPEYLKLPDGFFPTDAEIDAELDEIDALFEQESGKTVYRPSRLNQREASEAREARRALYHQDWDEIFTLANRDTMRIWGVRCY